MINLSQTHHLPTTLTSLIKNIFIDLKAIRPLLQYCTTSYLLYSAAGCVQCGSVLLATHDPRVQSPAGGMFERKHFIILLSPAQPAQPAQPSWCNQIILLFLRSHKAAALSFSRLIVRPSACSDLPTSAALYCGDHNCSHCLMFRMVITDLVRS